MELWQMDIMGGVYLSDGTELKAVTGIDDHSRFCVSAKVVRRATAKPVCDALAEAMRRHGVPDQILTDTIVLSWCSWPRSVGRVRRLLAATADRLEPSACRRGLLAC
jgi:transposase InsO family protein